MRVGLIVFSSESIALVAFILLAIVHVLLIIKLRKKGPNRKIPWIVLLGSIAVFVLTSLIYVIADEWIGGALNELNFSYSFYLVTLPWTLLPYLMLTLTGDHVLKQTLIHK